MPGTSEDGRGRRPGTATVVMLCGPPGAGKTSYARSLVEAGAERISYDEESWAMGFHGQPMPRAELIELDRVVKDKLRSAIAAGRDAVLDASMSTFAIRQELRAVIEDAGGEAKLVVFTASATALKRRMRERAGVEDANALCFDDATLDAYLTGFEWPGEDEPHELVSTEPH